MVVTDRHTFKTGLLAVDINVEEAVNDNFEVVMMIMFVMNMVVMMFMMTHRRMMRMMNCNQVNLKINNLNIEDIFDWQRMERLKKVFQNNLWQESHEVLVTTVKTTMMMMSRRKKMAPLYVRYSN